MTFKQYLLKVEFALGYLQVEDDDEWTDIEFALVSFGYGYNADVLLLAEYIANECITAKSLPLFIGKLKAAQDEKREK